MPATRFDDKTRLEMFDARRRGEPITKLSEKYGVHITTISHLCKRHGIKPGRKAEAIGSWKLTDAQKEELVARRQAGESAASLAQQFGIRKETVYAFLKRRGIASRPMKMSKPATEAVRQQVVSDYQDGFSTRECADRAGYSQRTCVSIVNAAIGTRGPSESRRALALNVAYFDDIDTPEKAYWLGFLAGDGYVSEDLGYVKLALKWSDNGHVRKFADAIEYAGRVEHRVIQTERKIWHKVRPRQKESHQAVAQVYSVQMAKSLARHGVTQAKSLTLKPWSGPDDLLSHFYRGLIDADGSVFKTKQGLWGVSLIGSFWAAQGFIDFVARHVRTKLKVPIRAERATAAYTVRYGGIGLPQHIASLLYKDAPVFLDRKKARADELMSVVPLRPYSATSLPQP